MAVERPIHTTESSESKIETPTEKVARLKAELADKEKELGETRARMAELEESLNKEKSEDVIKETKSDPGQELSDEAQQEKVEGEEKAIEESAGKAADLLKNLQDRPDLDVLERAIKRGVKEIGGERHTLSDVAEDWKLLFEICDEEDAETITKIRKFLKGALRDHYILIAEQRGFSQEEVTDFVTAMAAPERKVSPAGPTQNPEELSASRKGSEKKEQATLPETEMTPELEALVKQYNDGEGRGDLLGNGSIWERIKCSNSGKRLDVSRKPAILSAQMPQGTFSYSDGGGVYVGIDVPSMNGFVAVFPSFDLTINKEIKLGNAVGDVFNLHQDNVGTQVVQQVEKPAIFIKKSLELVSTGKLDVKKR